MNVSFEEIGRMAVTFAQNGCGAGEVCKVAGFAQVRFSGSLNEGYVYLCADGNGGVKAGSGREYLVVAVDENAGTAIFMM